MIGRVALLLQTFVRAGRLGQVILAPFDVRLGADVVQPDILYVSNARSGIRRGTHLLGSPDLVVEVLSPSTRERDLGLKRDLYEASGVLEYWQVDGEHRAMHAVALTDGRYHPIAQTELAVSSLVLRGLVVNLAELFADLP